MTDELLQQGVAALKAGDKVQARQLLGQAIRQNPNDEQAWLWMAGAVNTDQEKLVCLNKVLMINPDNEAAQRGLAALQEKSPALSIPKSPSPIETQPVPRIKPSLAQAVLSIDSPAAEPLPTPATTDAATIAYPASKVTDLLNHTQTLDQMSPEMRKALEGYTTLVSHEVTSGNKSRKEIVDRLVKRGFPRKAVDQFVSQVERMEPVRKRGLRTQGIPLWGWLFIVACGLIPVVSLGGAIPAIIGVGGALVCAAISRDTSKNIIVKVVLCICVTIASWIVYLILTVGILAA